MDESNVSQELLNSNRTEIARCVLLKDLVVMYGGYEVYANHVDLLMCFHQLMIVLGEMPLSHSGIVLMLHTSTLITKLTHVIDKMPMHPIFG
ncbi:Ovule protein [Caenorhabditis elegans]|uniref:Ovule protein n=1 Tax=Caenorhabditis elegans TaxID=6239 RepID=Q9N4P7_CAEEL|nr:Ovule protein [Caenorhabditis elegans]CCD62263.2 Ovule protein [Caenorhabditis elegans]